VYPILVRIGDFEVTTFGVLVALGALMGLWIFRAELRRSDLSSEGVDAALIGVLGGLVGAKLVWAVEFRDEAPFLSLLFSRGGLSWFGGFLGGVGAGLWALHRRRIPIMAALAAASPALAIGHAIGRIGCFMVGDDYGRGTDLPWGVAFPEGLPPTSVPVHPTQLYEAAGLAVIAWALIHWRRLGRSDVIVFARYLVLTGTLRFLIEFIRVNAHVAGPFTVAHLFSAAVVGIGVSLMFTKREEGQMKKSIAAVLVVVASLFAYQSYPAAAPQTWTGQIGDSMCGAMHKPMGTMKMADRECTEMCLKAGGKYVFITGGKVFQITDQKDKALATHAGHTVLLTGELKGETITVSKIEMPKKETPKAEMPKMDMPMPKK
jgi:phosphatidylglycerol:prolipoprotein diacylglycerol transferase